MCNVAGPLEVRILNKANEEMSRLPGTRKKLLTELKLIYHCECVEADCQ